MYEVLRFIEHGTYCRQSMDCIRGTPLIRYLKENPRIGKEELFKWFRQLCVCLDQYHRCRSWKEYRYLNPYSVIVSEEGELLLLDLEAPENAFVMKQMQKRAVRDHFVKPVCRIKAGKDQKADLFAYGKTIQFLLAYTEVVPALTRREETRLSRVIDRCMGESGREYEDITQVLKALPVVKPGRSEPKNGKRKKLVAAVCFCILACAFLKLGINLTVADRKNAVTGGIRTQKENLTHAAPGGADGWKVPADEDVLEAAGNILKKYVSVGAENEIRTGLALGRKIELDIVRCLAEMYENLDMPEEAAETYGRLIQIETDPGQVEAAGIRKMELEADQEEYERAVETGEDVLKRLEDSAAVTALTEEYRAKAAEDIKEDDP